MQPAEAAEPQSETLPAKTRAWSSVWQMLIRYQSDKVNPRLAVRNTMGVALPLGVGAALGAVSGSLAMTTGALNVAFSDGHEPYAQRARRMFAASGLVGLAVCVGSLSGHNHLTAVFAAGLWAFAAGLLVALSTDVGTISLVTLVVYSAFPMPLEKAVYSGLLALGGGLLQTVLAVAFWPLSRYRPERRALGDLYLELSRAVAVHIPATEAPPASTQMTQAQQTLAPLHRDHSFEGERYRLLLSQAERTRLTMLSLRRLRARVRREDPVAPELEILEVYFANCSRVLGAIGHSLVAAQAAPGIGEFLEELETSSERLRKLDESAADALILARRKDARTQMDALTGQLRSAVDLAVTATPAGLAAFEQREAGRPWTLRLSGTLATLRANLHQQSAALRHAVRLAVWVGAGDALARVLKLPRSYWLPMTIAIVLKPDFTATFSRGVLRLAGTFVGLAFATELFHLLPPGLAAQVVVIAALTFLMRCFGPANYGIASTAITALVVLLLAVSGLAPKVVIGARALNTVAGGTIALADYLIWPTWERTQLAELMAQMLDAYREYFRVIREGYIRREPSAWSALDRARLAGRLARSNLQASIDRLSAEPGTPAAAVKLLAGALASSHRLAHAMMALEAGLYSSQPVPARPAFSHFASDVDLTLYYQASALRGSPFAPATLPDLREDHHAPVHSGDALAERYALVNVETDRVTNSLNTLSEELLRWIASQKQT
jgi:uncharacterized membrane protein YccC